MRALLSALALISGAVGAGFASGREIVRFFAAHGAMAGAAVVCALGTLALAAVQLCAQMEHAGVSSLHALCHVRFGGRLGRLCALLFLLLFAVTGGAMLAACAELAALVLPLRHAYAAGMAVSVALASLLLRSGVTGLSLPGGALLLLLPALLIRLLALNAGEACFLPAMAPDLPVRAVLDGVAYGALNAAMLSGTLPLLLPLPRGTRRRAALLFSVLFGALLLLATAVCRRHLPAVLHQAMPFVHLSRALGKSGYLLVAACLYAAGFSTLLAMMAGIRGMCPRMPAAAPLLPLLFALFGFGRIVESGYPVLGALCAGLLFLLCFPADMRRKPI